MKANAFFLISIILLILLVINYALGVLTMIELWQVSIALAAISFGAWFEIHSKYGEKAQEMKRRILQRVHLKIRDVCELIKSKERDKKIESQMASISRLYEKSDEPMELYKNTWGMFSYAGLCFLAAVFSRLGMDLLFISELSQVESITFLIGAFLFLIGILNAINLMKLFGSEEDNNDEG